MKALSITTAAAIAAFTACSTYAADPAKTPPGAPPAVPSNPPPTGTSGDKPGDSSANTGGTHPAMSAEESAEIFKKLDANNDGNVSREEFKKINECLREHAGKNDNGGKKDKPSDSTPAPK